jgi:outer membrane protein OmpA-like peptidoglycan-associated protein
MRSGLSRIALALSLFALAPFCAAKSYVVLLKNPLGIENHVHIINSKGMFGINNPGYGTDIGKYIQTVHRYEPEQIKADFSDALESMSAILAAGLPPLPHSYTALLELPQGPLGTLAFHSEKGDVILDEAGQGVLLDGYSDDPYQVDMQTVRKDFGPALVTLEEVIAGLRPQTYIVLLEDPEGGVGKVIIDDNRGETVIDEAGEAVDMGIYLTDEKVFKVKEEAVKEDFGNAIESRPPLPAKYVLLFKSGSTKIAQESQEEADRMLEDIKSRPAPDITIGGHADTVGKDSFNDKLSLERAKYISEMIRGQGTELRAVEVAYYGEKQLYVMTRDNKPELKNRRVEITVR